MLGIALRRASEFSRAPVIHDLTIAFTIWGFLDPAPPADLVAVRPERFAGLGNLAHHYEQARALVDQVPDDDAADDARAGRRGLPGTVA